MPATESQVERSLSGSVSGQGRTQGERVASPEPSQASFSLPSRSSATTVNNGKADSDYK